MRFVFLALDFGPIHAKIIEERPVGGTATGVIRISEILNALGHDVVVITSMQNPPNSTGVRYIDATQAYNSLGPCDVLIVNRGWWRIFSFPFPYKKCFFWTGDSYDYTLTIGFGDLRVINRYDGLFAVSHWHAETLCQASGFPKLKTWILRNGVHLPYFTGSEQRIRKRLIYSSLPHRGLILLPRIFSELKKRHPDAELHVFGSFNRNATEWNPEIQVDPNFESTLQALRAIPDCTIHGSIPQHQLSREFMKSSILAYPCNFEETSCITAMEAQVAGCPVLTTHIAALKETVGDAGILINEKPGTEEYYQRYIEAADRLLVDDILFEKLSKAGKAKAEKLSWENSARTLLEYLEIAHRLS